MTLATFAISANAWTIAIAFATGSGTLILLRTGVQLVWDFVESAVRDK